MTIADDPENILAKSFHQHLDENGVEINQKETGILLHQLGLVYKSRSPDKLSLLKSAVLLNGAKLRNTDDVEEVKISLQTLCKHVLKLAKAENEDADLVEVSNEAKLKVEKMREVAEKAIEKSIKLPEILVKHDPKDKQDLLNGKINYIQLIQNQITSDFIEIMDDLATFTRKTLGDPPCRYAIVGIGSLARKEITPYSDFEQLIILEEGIEQQDDYENILEYFRWFSLIFLLTLINLGEMIIPFADIQSFQHFQPKFRDEVAKVGICPDGFNLSAGKNAICGHIELIKTPSEMAICLSKKFLESNFPVLISEETAHFVNTLCKTRFVSGDTYIHYQLSETLHQTFVKNYEFHMTLLQASIDKEYLDFDIFKKLQNYSQNDRIDVKRMVYRTSTLYIVAMGKRYTCKSASCSDILSELKKKQILSEESEMKLKYILALACELRLKTYKEEGQQQDNIDDIGEDNVEKLKLLKAIGLQSAVDYFSITTSLQESARMMIARQENTFLLHPEFRFIAASYLTDAIDAISYIDRIYESNFDLSNNQPDMINLLKRNGLFNNLIRKDKEISDKNALLLKNRETFENLLKILHTKKQCTINSSSAPEACKYSVSESDDCSNEQPILTEDKFVGLVNDKPNKGKENNPTGNPEISNDKGEKENIKESYAKRNETLFKMMRNINPNKLLESDPTSFIQALWGDAKTENQQRIKTSVTENIKFLSNGSRALDHEEKLLVQKLEALGWRPFIEGAFKSDSREDSNPQSIRDLLKYFNLPSASYESDIIQGLNKRDLHGITLEELVKVIGEECLQIGYNDGLKFLEIFLEQTSDNVAELGVQFLNKGGAVPQCSRGRSKSTEGNSQNSQKDSGNVNEQAHSDLKSLSAEDKSLFDDFMKSFIHLKVTENNKK